MTFFIQLNLKSKEGDVNIQSKKKNQNARSSYIVELIQSLLLSENALQNPHGTFFPIPKKD